MSTNQKRLLWKWDKSCNHSILNQLSFLIFLLFINNTFAQAVYDGSSKHTFTTNHGKIEIGPFNTSWGHIYTDRPKIIFNKDVYTTSNAFSSYNNDLILKTKGTERLRINDDTGNVGIGYSNPVSPLHIVSGIDAIQTYQTNDDSWLYTQWRSSNGTRKAYMGLNSALNEFIINVENGTNEIILNGGNVGIGTSSPGAKLEVNSTIKINNPANRGNGNLFLDRGSEGKDRAAIAYGENGTYGWYTGLLYSYGSPSPHFYINRTDYIRDQNGFRQPEFVIGTNGNVGIGVLTPDSKLAVNGNIHAKEVKVDLIGWPDYVFKEDYDLPTLEEVEEHIKEKGHLIKIPSAKEVEENGILLGEMNKLLLEKIEELTLYMLQQEKRMNRQQSEIESLKKYINSNKKP